MATTSVIKQLNMIESTVAAHPNGIGITDIETDIKRHEGHTLSRRTLLRRLQRLIDEQPAVIEGASIARYRLRRSEYIAWQHARA